MPSPATDAVATSDAVRAARQAGALFLLSGLSSVIADATLPGPQHGLLVVAIIDLAVGLLAFLLPWDNWDPRTNALLVLPAWVVIAIATWSLGTLALGTGAFLVLAFAWMGLHHTRRTILVNAPIASVAYLIALLGSDAPRYTLTAITVLLPTAVVVGLIISGRVGRLNEAREVIVEEQRWRAALMATLAHDVRSPLTTIHGALEIVADDEDLPEHLRPLVAAATRQTGRLTTLASNLLDLERVEGGKLILDWQRIDLAEMAGGVSDLLGNTGISVDVEPGLAVTADPLRLQQMLINLGTNAQRHGRPPFVIGARRSTSGTEVFVRDHGSGVPEAELARLFQRLNRSEGNPESVGLGLWIVRLLAQAHGGDALYRPATPGAEFLITLPDRSPTVPLPRAVVPQRAEPPRASAH